MRIAKIIILLFLLLAGLSASQAAPRVRFKQVSVLQGLSQSTVFDIAQDSKGYLWVATIDGLNRYDGYRFTTYRHSREDAASLGGNLISKLLVDGEGTLWIGTGTGLSRYNPATDDFSNYLFRDQSMHIYDIAEAGEDQLFLAGDAGVIVFNKREESFELRSGMEGTRDKSLCTTDDGVLVGTAEGVYLYSPQLGTTRAVIPQLAHIDISDIIHIPDEGYWIATFGHGLYRTDAKLRITGHYSRSDGAGLGSDYIRVLKMDNEQRLWIGSFDGLYIMDTETGRIDAYTHSADDESSLSQNSIRSIFIDDQKGVWLGTYYGGLCYYHPMVFRFGSLRHQAAHNSLSDNTVSCIVEQPSTGNLWIGTNDGGLNYYESSPGRFTVYRTDRTPGLLSNNIKCVLQDGEAIWIGTHAGGLSRMDTRTGRMANYRIDTPVQAYNSVYSLLDVGDGHLWAGTLNGLFLFDKRSGRFTPHPCATMVPRLGASDINTLFRDASQHIWIGSNRGLFRMSADATKVDNFETITTTGGERIPNPNVTCVTEDSRGRIWVGADVGLMMYDEQQGRFVHYTTRDGLPNDYVLGILEDPLGRLWISTNRGLSRFDPFDGTFRNYNQLDGLRNEQFNHYAYCLASSGVMYFGGIEGITMFNPTNLADNPYSPRAMITGVTLFNREAAGEKGVRMKVDPTGNLQGVRFPSRYGVFGIRYVVVNPIASGNNSFSYTLKGFDNQWYDTRSREVSYSNLPPGRYTFMLRSANNDGVWCPEVTSFTVDIAPMWYQTLLAKILYVLCGAGVLLLFVRFWMERTDRKRTEEMSQEKVRFYVNLSHELRTPLSLILSPLEELENHATEDGFIERRVGLIRRNAVKLLHMVNQMLDYRKAESGILRIRVAGQQVEPIVSDIFSMFDSSAGKRDIDYSLNSQLGDQRFFVDRMFLERILINLLSNAFKFTPDSGSVRVSASAEQGRLVIRVADNGRGISHEDKARIFDRFYKVDESRPGTGIGLSIVQRLVEMHHGTITVGGAEGQGTEFTVTLPGDADAYTAEELTPRDEREREQKIDPTFYLENSAALPAEEGEGMRAHEPGQETILVVEDNAEIRQYLRDAFGGRYNVVTATDGRQALSATKEHVPDVIITDLMMPVMDGIKLVQTLKQNIRTCHIPVIILTAKDSPDDQIRGMEAGADDYLTKPFSLQMLHAKVSSLLKARYRLLHHYANTQEMEPEKIAHNPMDGEFLRKAAAVVERHIGNVDFSTDEFCNEMCMSRSSLHLKMKSITGSSTIDFIRRIRLGYACRLLTEGLHTVTEISEMAGFSTPSYFATTFKKHIGCMPSEYVKSHKGKGNS